MGSLKAAAVGDLATVFSVFDLVGDDLDDRHRALLERVEEEAGLRLGNRLGERAEVEGEAGRILEEGDQPVAAAGEVVEWRGSFRSRRGSLGRLARLLAPDQGDELAQVVGVVEQPDAVRGAEPVDDNPIEFFALQQVDEVKERRRLSQVGGRELEQLLHVFAADDHALGGRGEQRRAVGPGERFDQLFGVELGGPQPTGALACDQLLRLVAELLLQQIRQPAVGLDTDQQDLVFSQLVGQVQSECRRQRGLASSSLSAEEVQLLSVAHCCCLRV